MYVLTRIYVHILIHPTQATDKNTFHLRTKHTTYKIMRVQALLDGSPAWQVRILKS